jgi:ribose 5-phosphate isomerase B
MCAPHPCFSLNLSVDLAASLTLLCPSIVLYDENDFGNRQDARKTMKIAIASDHGGFELKEQIKRFLQEMNIDFEDFGTNNSESVDYPDFAEKVAREVQNGMRGILCCGTGIGMSIAANKFKGVRAALCHDEFTARVSRQHNDSNILVLGGRVQLTPQSVSAMVKAWLETQYEGGRHQKRLEKIEQMEGNS